MNTTVQVVMTVIKEMVSALNALVDSGEKDVTIPVRETDALIAEFLTDFVKNAKTEVGATPVRMTVS